jgi:hypothetical protein
MKIYRIEHKKSKLGPYRHSLLESTSAEYKLFLKEMADRHHDKPSTPDPLDDFYPDHHDWAKKWLGIDTKHVKFGFPNLEELKKWFGKDLKTILQFDFDINEYESDVFRLSLSEKQVMFLSADNAEYEKTKVGAEKVNRITRDIKFIRL